MNDAEVTSLLRSVRPAAQVVAVQSLGPDSRVWTATQEGVNNNSHSKIKRFLNNKLPKDVQLIQFVPRSSIKCQSNCMAYQLGLK